MRRAAAAVLTALALAAGCRRDEAAEQAAAAGAIAEREDHTVRVAMIEWRVDPSRREAPAGETTLRVVNMGTREHELVFEGAGTRVTTGRISPGQEKVMTAELPAGSYEIYCPIEDSRGVHRRHGMQSTLTVK